MSACPPESRLSEYARGGLAPDDRRSLEAHFEACSTCYNTVVDLEIEEVLPSQPGGDADVEAVPGRTIGPYRLVRELGRGGQARVFLAEDTRLPRKVALKVFSSSFALSAETRTRFEREASALSRLDHRGICGVHEVGTVDGCAYLAMRYVEGQTLGERIAVLAEAKARGVSPDRAKLQETIEQIERAARALHVAHEAGLIHRDIKPSNIMLQNDGEPVILDFGLAKESDGAGTKLTRTGDIAGTPAYMSPEQIQGGPSRLDRRSDVFSLGITLYEALTLRLPFEAPTTPRVFQEILTGTVPDPTRSNSLISRDLRVILETALDRDPHRRYQTALAFAEDLRRYRCHETILARPASPGLRVRRWSQRNPQVAVALAATFLMLVAALGVSVVFLDRTRAESEARAALLRKEEGLRLAFQSSTVLNENPGQALLIAVEAAKRAPSLEANLALLGSLESCREQMRLLGHSGSVKNAIFSRDGRLVGTASTDRTARVWNAVSGELVSVASGHEASVMTVDISPDDRRLLTASVDGTARLWDVASGKQLAQFPTSHDTFSMARFSPDGRTVLAAGSGSISLWDTETAVLLRTLEGHSGRVYCARFSPDGSLVASGGDDKTVIVHDASSGQIRARFPDHEGIVLDVGWSSSLLIAGCTDGTARVWDYSSGQLVSKLRGHVFGIYSAALTPDGTRAVTGSEDFTARIWDVRSGKELSVLSHDHKVIYLELSTDGRLVVTASYDRIARVWRVEDGSLVVSFKGHAAPIEHAVLSRDGERVLTSSVDFTARIWSVRAPQPVPVIPSRVEEGLVAAFDPKGLHLALGGGQLATEARIVSAPGGETERDLVGHEGAIVAISYSPDGASILTGAKDGTARVWDAETGKCRCVLRGHLGKLIAARFSSDGRRVITASEDRTVRVWDAATSEGRSLIGPIDGILMSSSFSPDGTKAMGALLDGTVLVADATSGSRVISFREDIGGLASAEWCPDSRRIVVTAPTTRAHVWNAERGEIVDVLVHPSRVSGARYSPDGRRIATSCEDRIVRIWDAESRDLELQLKQDGYQSSSFWFDPNGQSITVQFLRIDGRVARGSQFLRYRFDLLAEALKLLPGSLTPEERDQFGIGTPEERAAHRKAWRGGMTYRGAGEPGK